MEKKVNSLLRRLSKYRLALIELDVLRLDVSDARREIERLERRVTRLENEQ